MIRTRHLFLLTALVLLAVTVPAVAQSTLQSFTTDLPFTPERTGGVYYAYPVGPSESAQTVNTELIIPDGMEVFYISHYGRHGSRWLPDQERYDWTLSQFQDTKNLTKAGRQLRRKLRAIAKNARGNAGQLTPLGHQQHRGIARRMAQRFPQVFAGDDTWLQARSSTVPRCRESMLAFCDELSRHLSPAAAARLQPETQPAFMAYINHEPAELKALSRRVQQSPVYKRLTTISPQSPLFTKLFKDPAKVQQPWRLIYELHTIASDMQDIPLDVSLWDVFSREEMLAVHAANDWRMNQANGPSPLNDGIPARASIPLWQNIEREADSLIACGGHGASLRFGHDTALFRLMTLMGLTSGRDHMEQLLPMAANLQLVFARNAEGDVAVAMLHNERLLIPFEPWPQLKERMHRRIHDLEHRRQLASLNTMVGTAQANTRTAGLFGKGSEEHGQTLPAVLVPNGQTFWTPQTRDSETKCLAPFYYADSLLQGFRASHWLVGGCTQDYGSFTIAAMTGQRRLQPEQRATRFSHSQEVSHPYYYKVFLPDEQLLIELTGLSHAAVMRVTPTHDGPVHIVVNPNSDEGQGSACPVDGRTAWFSNPVHRIYQGKGEPAGFSGHLALEFTDETADFGAFYGDTIASDADGKSRCGVWYTFQGRAGQPIELRMATSFTSTDGAWRNMQQELGGLSSSRLSSESLSFEQVVERNIALWTERFHTIDVDDADTARVDQFYGALYRASFLPREMSDADGSYPRFAGNANVAPSAAEGGATGAKPRKYYGDFSMWDTYRALHPLYNIIVPKTSADMMQSLVTMYQEGGWLPIFPCWNSYTAAMIGDHCTSVLADAYVKGIRGFDALKAYEGMRKNAMESPKTDEEYRNGMGRRALKSYLRYGYIPLEDPVREAYHQQEQTSRTLEYAYDDFCLAQMAKVLAKANPTAPEGTSGSFSSDYRLFMARSANWRNVINPLTGYADGRHADGSWEQNTDLVHRKPYITEGATCHYTWYVPHDVPGLIERLGGQERFVSKLDSMFTEGRYWHGNEPCHQVPWLFALAGHPEKTRHWVAHILDTEYNDTPGGLSGNDDAGQMSAWQVFAMLGFYPVCPATPFYVLGAPVFSRVTINQPGGTAFTIEAAFGALAVPLLNGRPLTQPCITHDDITRGGLLSIP